MALILTIMAATDEATKLNMVPRIVEDERKTADTFDLSALANPCA